MNAKKEAKLNMYHSVISLCEGHLAIVAMVAAFQISYDAFKITVSAIMSAATQLAGPVGGLRVSKKISKKDLAGLGSGIAGMVFAYASVINNQVLKGDMHITKSDIINAKDEDVVLICQNIHSTATAHLASLGDYGVTAAVLLAFQNAINDYANKAPLPILSRSQKKALRAQMYSMFDDADIILKEQMDKLSVNYLSNNNVLFYGRYHSAREIMDPGSYSTVLKVLALNAATNEPIKNVKCYRDDSKVAKKSSKNGFVTYKNIEQGGHSFRLKHKLFADGAGIVMMAYGEKKVLNVMMNP